MRDVDFLLIGFYPNKFKVGGKLGKNGTTDSRERKWKH